MAGWANHDDVIEQLRSVGLLIELPLRLATGAKSVRCKVDGEGPEKRGWYRLHEWQIEPGVLMLVGAYGIFHGAKTETWKVELTKRCAACGAEVGLKAKTCQACGHAQFASRELTTEQRAAFRARLAEDRKRAAAERELEVLRLSAWATAIWRASTPADPGGHPYLVRKQISGTGGARIFPGVDGISLPDATKDDYRYLATFAGHLAVPLCDQTGRVFGLQFIAPKPNPKTGRDKTYWPPACPVDGHYYLVGSAPQRLCLVAEGFATALTLHETTGQPVALAFSANNIPSVARALNTRWRGRAKLLLCADDDRVQKCLACGAYTPVTTPTCASCGQPHRQQNAGISRCDEAALVIDQAATFAPTFAAPRPDDRKGPTDFNDLAQLEGPHVVATQFEQRISALGWQAAAATPNPAPSLQCLPPGGTIEGGGERPDAVAILSLDAIVERFIPIDDGTGEYVWDTWTRKLAKRTQMITLLPAGVRGDDIKRDPVWIARGARYIDEIGFDPSGTDPTVKLNTWRGWPMRPQAGCCERLLELLYYLCSGDPQADSLYNWVLNWMAYPLQYPGAKMSSAVIMHGPQGTGKSTIWQAYAKIYGDYATVLNQRGLEDKFNADWVDSKLFTLAEEVVNRSEMWQIQGELKLLITGEWLRINPKNVAATRQRNRMNLVFLSNAHQPLPLDNDDRRHCVIYTPPEMSAAYYDAVQIEIRDGGIPALYHYLLHRDLSDWHPAKRPPMTEAKAALMHLSAPSENRFIGDWLSRELDLPVCPCEGKDLYTAYLRWCRTHGEPRPRPDNQFHGAIKHIPGWEKRPAYIYTSLVSSTRAQKQLVFPPPAVLAACGTGQPEGEKEITWLTQSVVAFSDALHASAADR